MFLGRFSNHAPRTCGITSPARWISTVSPLRTSSRAISSALCSVAFCTTTPPTRDRFELRHRRQRAGAADLDIDVLDDRRCLLGSKLVRRRPARRARHETEPLLPVEPVEFVNDAVNIVVELGALTFDVAIELPAWRSSERHNFISGLVTKPIWPNHFTMPVLGVFRYFAEFTPRIGEEFQRPRCCDRGIELTQRSRRGVARIDVKLLAGRRLLLVQFQKIRLAQINLAAHLAHGGHVAALQFLRNILDGAHVGGDVLAFRAVATGRAV